MSDNGRVRFDEVLAEELANIRRRRTQAAAGPAAPSEPASPDDLARERAQQRAALGMDLCGMAISGGGIRSATFALGVLQGLASFGLLRRLDYLSTVSGGGYIGSWLAAWIKRRESIDVVESQLDPNRRTEATGRGDPTDVTDEEPEAIRHLRAYSSYLTPRRGLFSADTCVLIAIYLRNILLNQAVLLPACVAVLLVPRLLERLFDWPLDVDQSRIWDPIVEGAMFVALAVGLAGIVGRGILTHTAMRQYATDRVSVQHGVHIFHATVIVPLFLFAILASWDLSWDLARWEAVPHEAHLKRGVLEGAKQGKDWWQRAEQSIPWQQGLQDLTSTHIARTILFGTIFGGALGLAALVQRLVILLAGWIRPAPGAPRQGPGRMLAILIAFAVSSALGGFAGGALLYTVFGVALRGLYDLDLPQDVAIMTTVGPPLTVLIIIATVIVVVGLLGTVLQEDEREWWASLCGWLLMYAAGWLVVVGISLFGPWLLWQAGVWGRTLLTAGWVSTAVGGALAARSPATGLNSRNRGLEALAVVAPPVFLLGLLCLLAFLIDAVQGTLPGDDDYFKHELGTDVTAIAVAADACALFALILGLRIDVNAFSLHGLYADRLVRCYLGASRAKSRHIDRRRGTQARTLSAVRQPDPVTGFDPADDIPLSRLQIREHASAPALPPVGAPTPAQPNPDPPYRGPFLLINTAMNLVQGDELAWQERKAESFVLSACYCGSATTGYRHLGASDADTLRLGTAVTLSGAAVSPNMGYHSSPAVTALLTVFNARLGGWVANPRYGTPSNTGPWQGLLYLYKEVFGRTNDRAGYVYLSDGGHFENLGVYELVRRRCRFIIACDGEQDSTYAFDALGKVIQKCTIDFGVRIEIDVTPIRPQGAGGRSRWHCAIGRIRYDDVEPAAMPGLLLYMKASMTGDEPSDVLNYAQEHPDFPHDPTANQFFTESQFESYRHLGLHVAQEVFGDAVRDIDGGPALRAMDDATHRRVLAQLFGRLYRRWFPPPPDFDATFIRAVEGYVRIERELRTDDRLRDFSRSLYPELAADPSCDGEVTPAEREVRRRAELHLSAQMLQVMENAWLGLHLEGYFAYPMNRGWMNTFRRWASCATFRRYWPVLRGEFGKDFVRFCDAELKLGGAAPALERIEKPASFGETAPEDAQGRRQWHALDRVYADFHNQWPDESLGAYVQRAADAGGNVWLVHLPEVVEALQGDRTCGIVLAWRPDPTPSEIEILVWMRGPYRDIGYGRSAVEQTLCELANTESSRNSALRTRFPAGDQLGGAESPLKGMWRAFFGSFGFRSVSTAEDGGKVYTILRAEAASWWLAITAKN
jgi:hypothetical protein